MGGGPPSDAASSLEDRSSEDAVEVSKKHPLADGSHSMGLLHPETSSMAPPSQTNVAEDGASYAFGEDGGGEDVDPRDRQAKLLYSKSKVYLHPSSYLRDNIPGFISIVQVGEGTSTNYLLAWIPEAAIEGTPDFESYVLVELSHVGSQSSSSSPTMVAAPPSETTSHAFSIPIRNLYSLLIQAPTLSAWFGSVTFNLYGGTTLPPLYFHDEESRSTVLDRDRRTAALSALGGRTTHTMSHDKTPNPNDPLSSPLRNLPPSWGGEALLSQLRLYSHIVRSQLEPQLFLVNPSRADLDVHSTALFEDEAVPPEAMIGLRLRGEDGRGDGDELENGIDLQRRRLDAAARAKREGKRSSILHQSLEGRAGALGGSEFYPDEIGPSMDNLTFSVLNSFSKLTRGARQVAQQAAQSVLSHPLAKPILKNIPEPIANFANAPGEISRLQETAGVGNYDSARVYLANWAREVAEEGERARRAEVIFAGPGGRSEDSEVGAFEVLASTYSITRPKCTRASATPIIVTEWAAWFDDTGKLMLSEAEAKKRIFQRGLADEVRKDVWPFLLNVYPWKSSTLERKKLSASNTQTYDGLKSSWKVDKELQSEETYAEESHRIEIDCRRTDRTHPMFMVSDEDASAALSPESEGQHSLPHPRSNRHIKATQDILTTYVFTDHSDVRNYVQGMSDLLSPIYVVAEGDEAMAYWQFGTYMERMKDNFLRDQSGMKRQLSELQALIALMDPQLHKHLEQTGSLNLFFCFRWILCSFKRELSFESTLRLWEVLWTDHCGKHLHLFVALAILEAHRDVIIRYLREFDEVLQYINKLSGTLDLEAILGDAEVLYLTFRKVVDASDQNRAHEEERMAMNPSSATGMRHRVGTATEGVNGNVPGEAKGFATLDSELNTTSTQPTVVTKNVPEIDDVLRVLLH